MMGERDLLPRGHLRTLVALVLAAVLTLAVLLTLASLGGCTATSRPINAGFGLGPTGWFQYGGGTAQASLQSALVGDSDKALPAGVVLIGAGDGAKVSAVVEVNGIPGSHTTTHANQTGIFQR